MLAQVVATKQRKSGVQTEVAVKERVNGPLNWFRPSPRPSPLPGPVGGVWGWCGGLSHLVQVVQDREKNVTKIAVKVGDSALFSPESRRGKPISTGISPDWAGSWQSSVEDAEVPAGNDGIRHPNDEKDDNEGADSPTGFLREHHVTSWSKVIHDGARLGRRQWRMGLNEWVSISLPDP